MKQMKLATVAAVATVAIMFACQPSKVNPPSSTTSMQADKTSIKPGESVSFAVKNGAQGAVAKWSVVPNTNVTINRAYSWDQTNRITFNQPGVYAVTAEIRKVWCDSVAASHPGMDTCLNSGTDAGKASATIEVKN